MSSAQRYSCLPVSATCKDQRDLSWFNTPACSEGTGQLGRPSSANTVTPSCGLSLPSFARPVAFYEQIRQFFSLCLRLVPEIAVPAWAVSQCDGGHGAAVGCAQLLLPSAADRLCFFGARPQGIPESI